MPVGDVVIFNVDVPDAPRVRLAGLAESVSPRFGTATGEIATVPLNPERLVTVILTAPAPPAVTVSSPWLEVMLKSITLTVTRTEWESSSPFAVPVMLRLYIPGKTDPATPISSVAKLLPPEDSATVSGFRFEVKPEMGERERETLPANPPSLLKVIVQKAELPGETFTTCGSATPKSTTFTVKGVEWVRESIVALRLKE